MTDESVKKPAPAPAYSTYKTLMTFIDGLSPGIPPVIDRSIMARMSGSAQAATLSSLRFLKLIDSNDKPTDLLKQLSGSEGEERQAAILEMVSGAYGLVSDGEVDLSTATSGQVEEWFRNQGVRGATVSRAYTFFVRSAEDAGMQLSRYMTDHRPKRQNTNGGSGAGSAGKKKKRTPRKLNLPAEPIIPKGMTKFDVPIPGNTVPASLILPNNLTADDWGMLKQMFDLYAERHIAAGGTDSGDG